MQTTFGVQNIVYGQVLDLSTCPETTEAVSSGRIKTVVFLPCTADGCLSGFSVDNIHSLTEHIRKSHPKLVKGRTSREIAAQIPPSQGLCFAPNKFVRLINGALPGFQVQATFAVDASLQPKPIAAQAKEKESDAPLGINLPTMTPPRAPAPKETAAEAVSRADLARLPSEEIRRLAPRFATDMTWHTGPLSCVIGDSNSVPGIFKAGEDSEHGMGRKDLTEAWRQALEDVAVIAALMRSVKPSLAGFGEAQNKTALSQDWLSAIAREDTDDAEPAANIGAPQGRVLQGLSDNQIRHDARVLADLGVFLNGLYEIENKAAVAAKRTRLELPFPADLQQLSMSERIQRLWLSIFTLELGTQEKIGLLAGSASLGALGYYAWAKCLRIEKGSITGFATPASMASTCNTLLHVLQYCVLYNRQYRNLGPDSAAFHASHSGDTLASLRKGLKSEEGMEVRETVLLDVGRTMELGHSVVSVSHKGEATHYLSLNELGAAMTRSTHFMSSKTGELLHLLGISDSKRIADPASDCFKFTSGRTNLTEFTLDGCQTSNSKELAEVLRTARGSVE